jgi:predicted dehydrogenase
MTQKMVSEEEFCMKDQVLGIGLYGMNGHQIQHLLLENPRARLVAVSGMSPEWLDRLIAADAGLADIRSYETLDGLLSDPAVDLVSLCSPVRANQATETIRCLYAGKHVYAEKPCALTEDELDEILTAAQENGKIFHEMAGTAFSEPYATVMDIVQTGKLGPIIQAFAQKSYPWHAGRPKDEAIDGGLILQCSIHAIRMIEQVSGLMVTDIEAIETNLGNPDPDSDLKMAAILMLRLQNGGVAAVTANYLNQAEFGIWGHEQLRLFGSRGFVETTEKGEWIETVIQGEGMSRIRPTGGRRDYFEWILDEIIDGRPMPLTLNEEVHPTRVVIRARQSVRRQADHP